MEFLYCLSRMTHEKFRQLHIYRPIAVIWLREGFGLCSEFKIVMLGREQPYFRLLIFSLKIDLSYFLYICDEYVQMIFCVCLPSIMENDVSYHGKVMEFSWNFIITFLWEPCVCCLVIPSCMSLSGAMCCSVMLHAGPHPQLDFLRSKPQSRRRTT